MTIISASIYKSKEEKEMKKAQKKLYDTNRRNVFLM